jgi:hypothetical protein
MLNKMLLSVMMIFVIGCASDVVVNSVEPVEPSSPRGVWSGWNNEHWRSYNLCLEMYENIHSCTRLSLRTITQTCSLLVKEHADNNCSDEWLNMMECQRGPCSVATCENVNNVCVPGENVIDCPLQEDDLWFCSASI